MSTGILIRLPASFERPSLGFGEIQVGQNPIANRAGTFFCPGPLNQLVWLMPRGHEPTIFASTRLVLWDHISS
ncbi:hypothetical protein OPQ81_005782 [Rhizoctonia solani]|nr:hypothetical protein OPQ81_005782 [Rhizoctonia solani]